METNTQTPQNSPSTELVPVQPQSAEVALRHEGGEIAVPQSREVVQYQLENDGVVPAGFEVAIPSSELAVPAEGEVVPLEERPPVIKARHAIESTRGEEAALIAEHLEAYGVESVAERNLREETEAEEPALDKLLVMEGSEEIYAVQVGSETRRLGIIELLKYLVSVRESAPGVSVIDKKGNVLMHANGEIAEAIAETLQQAYLGRVALKIMGVILETHRAYIEYRGALVETQATSAPVAAEAPQETGYAQSPTTAYASAEPATVSDNASTSAAQSSEVPQSESASEGAATNNAETPSTEMATYDAATAEANANAGTGEAPGEPAPSAEADSAQQSGAESQAAIESAESRMANDVLDDLLPDERITVAQARVIEQKARRRLAKEKIHPDIPDSDAESAYATLTNRLEKAVGGRIDRGL